MAKPGSPARLRAGAERQAPRQSKDLHLVIITGLSGSGKGSVIKVFEDSGYYSVDNLPLGLLPHLVELVRQTGEVNRVAAVIDIRERQRLESLPSVLAQLRALGDQTALRLTLLFLEASDEALMRRFSETRRPHPLAGPPGGLSRKQEVDVRRGIEAERDALAGIRDAADLVIDTSKFNVHELRDYIQQNVIQAGLAPGLRVAVTSFGFRHGLPTDADLVFDVRFLPNPNYVPELREHTGRDRKVAEYIRSFPQTGEFLSRVRDLLAYLIPHYVREGKSYLNIAVGCTGGHHRSVYIAEALRRDLTRLGYKPAISHRDLRR